MRFTLVEGAPGKPTGRFEGHVTEAGLNGTWTPESGTDARSFSLQRVPRTGSLLTFVQHVRSKRKAATPSLGGLQTTCEVDVEYISVAGAADATADDALDQALQPQSLGLDSPCEEANVREAKARVLLNRDGLLGVIYDDYFDGGAHPSSSRTFLNLTVRDGTPISAGELFAASNRSKLARVLAPRLRKSLEGEGDMDVEAEVAELMKPDADFGMEAKGLRFSFFNHAPHAFPASFSDGVLVPWSALTPLLPRDGPLEPLLSR